MTPTATERRNELFETEFDALSPGAGYESPPCPVGPRDVAVFAALTGDRHPLHVDDEWAARGPFGRPIAHGLLVLSLAAGVLPLDPQRVLALRRIREVVFKRPVAVGEAIAVRCTVTATRVLDAETGLVECEWRIVGEEGRLRTRALVEILWRRGAHERSDGRGSDRAGVADVERDEAGDAELAPVVVGPGGTPQVLI